MGNRVQNFRLTGSEGMSILDLICLENNCLLNPTKADYDLGIDGFIEILDPKTRESTRKWVAVQCKTHNGIKLIDNTFLERIDKKDIQNWVESNVPVVLMIVDSKTKQAFWKPIAQSQASKSISKSITLRFEAQEDRFLPSSSVQLINHAVSKEFAQATLDSIITILYNRLNSHKKYFLATSITENRIIQWIQPRPGQTVKINGTIKLGLDDESNLFRERVKEWEEKGGSLRIPKKYFTGFVPEGFKTIREYESPNIDELYIEIRPIPHDHNKIRVNISISKEEQSFSKTLSNVKLYYMTGGTKEITFSNEPEGQPLVISIIQNLESFEKTITFTVKQGKFSPAELIAANELVEVVRTGADFTIFDINRYITLSEGKLLEVDSPSQKSYIEMLRALMLIQQTFNVVFVMPERNITDKEYSDIMDTFHILKDGKVRSDFERVTLHLPKQRLLKLLQEITDSTGFVYVQPDQSDHLTLFGFELERGPVDIHYPNLTIDKKELLRLKLFMKELSDDEIVEFEAIPYSGNYRLMYYKKWLSTTDQEKYYDYISSKIKNQ
jgi:hypothetical protein